ncbi:MAG: hypothetical protein ACKO6B_00435 [Planctomycetia bacterium]
MRPAEAVVPLAIQLGRADDMRAEIAVRVALEEDGDGERPQFGGTLVGPRRGRDMTLPTTVRLVAVAGDCAAVARAGFTEPAYWTPELPNLYRLEAEVRRGARTVAAIDRLVGLRRLGVRGRSLWLDGRRWVPRGVTISPAGFSLEALREAAAAAVIGDPSAEIRAAADQAGVAIVARLEDVTGRALDPDEATGRIASFALHPSVVLAVVPRTLDGEMARSIVAAARDRKGTMLVGLEVDGTEPPEATPSPLVDAVDCLVVSLPRDALPHEQWRRGRPDKPLVAQRANAAETVAERRRECDRLQADLAVWGLAAGAEHFPGDWAGYLAAAW